jgi:hypothetical protein
MIDDWYKRKNKVKRSVFLQTICNNYKILATVKTTETHLYKHTKTDTHVHRRQNVRINNHCTANSALVAPMYSKPISWRLTDWL